MFDTFMADSHGLGNYLEATVSSLAMGSFSIHCISSITVLYCFQEHLVCVRSGGIGGGIEIYTRACSEPTLTGTPKPAAQR
jgi:hypothetical protein